MIVRGERGKIFDSCGRVFAMDRNIYSIFADPNRVSDKKAAAIKIAAVLGMDFELVSERLNKDCMFIWLKRGLEHGKAQEYLKEIDLSGLGIKVERKRVYPHNTLASQVLGAVDIDNRGISGLEFHYNDILEGAEGYRLTLGDGKNLILSGFTTTYIPPKNGNALVLTIDQVLQHYAQEEARQIYEKYKAKRVSIVIMDPYKGDILSLVNIPTFNPNKITDADLSNMRNFAISDLFEPGSVFKVITAAALLDQGLLRLEDRVYCENGSYKIGRRILHDYHAYGDLDFKSVIVYSSNIGVAKSVIKMDRYEFYKYLKIFGIGEPTGIDLPGESGGILREPGSWSDYSQVSIAMGQEVAVNCLHLGKIMSIIANGGYSVEPHIVKEVRDENGFKVRSINPSKGERILSPEVAKEMQLLLQEAVESGTGRYAKSSLYSIAGKTGTAQKANLKDGGYYKNRYVATFMGFIPVEEPKIVIVVTVDEPQPLHFGGVVSAPVFKNIAEKAMLYLMVSENKREVSDAVKQGFIWN
ncbi:MAG: penicillin-binding protein 2 [Candidatus Kaelpia imicola]|nr:penicillin-binding protein 2 [Candidatus Kaelpia imicola]